MKFLTAFVSPSYLFILNLCCLLLLLFFQSCLQNVEKYPTPPPTREAIISYQHFGFSVAIACVHERHFLNRKRMQYSCILLTLLTTVQERKRKKLSNILPNHNKPNQTITSPADISFDQNLLVFLLDSKFQTDYFSLHEFVLFEK